MRSNVKIQSVRRHSIILLIALLVFLPVGIQSRAQEKTGA